MALDDRLTLPQPLSDRLHGAYGELFACIERGYLAKRPVTLRVNRLKTTPERVINELHAQGIGVQTVAWYEDALIAENVRESALQSLPMYERGEVYLQSLSSMLPPILLQPAAGENILDMTAAPGGKTTELFALSGGRALITACERDAVRFERLRFNLSRQGATRVNALKTDALALDDFLRFDKILLDAPCTGTGTISADERVRFSEGYLEKCVRLQRKLFEKAFRLLKKGGLLLYSTCSVLPEENGGILQTAQRLGATQLPVQLPSEIALLPSPEGTACVCPSALYEGFFLSMFTK